MTRGAIKGERRPTGGPAPATHQGGRAGLAEGAYDELLGAIVEQRLPAGARLVPETLAAQLGVSATPVKLALARLGAEGLVAEVPRRGIFVRRLSAEELMALFHARLLLELAAVREYGHRVTATFVRQLAGLIREYERLTQEGSPHASRALPDNDRAFHRSIVALTGNEHIVRWYELTNLHIQAYRAADATERFRVTSREHGAIVKAFRAADLAQVEQAIRAHIEQAMAHYEHLLRAAAPQHALRPLGNGRRRSAAR